MTLNSDYKRWHRPNLSGTKAQGGTSRTLQGYYKPQNPEKYIGDINLIIYRSSWEMNFCRWADFSPSVVRWSSEPMKVKYADKVSKLEECKKYGLDPNNPKNWVIKNYNVDFYVEIKRDENTIEKWLVEIKPANSLKKPVPPALNSSIKEQRRFNIEAKNYLINQEKWKSMNEHAQKMGAKFYVFTENELAKILGRHWGPNNE